MKKRILSFIMVLALVLSLLPVSALADVYTNKTTRSTSDLGPALSPDTEPTQHIDKSIRFDLPSNPPQIHITDVQQLKPDPMFRRTTNTTQTILNTATADTQRYTVLVLDISTATNFLDSSGDIFYTADTAIEHVKASAKKFIEQIYSANGTNHIAIVTYKGEKATIVSPFSTDLDRLASSIDSLYASESNRNVAAGLQAADTLISEITEPTAIKNVILFTTGMTTDGDYNYNGHYDENTVASTWQRMDTEINLYAYANVAYSAAKTLKSKSTLYTIGLFQTMEDMPEAGHEVVQFFKLCTLEWATSPDCFYDVKDPNDLEFIFGDVADDIVNDDCPIIVIPGIAGSEMIDSSGKLLWLDLMNFWEGTITKMGLYSNGESINDVSPKETGYGTRDTYKDLITALEKEYGKEKVYFFAYDWRMDNAATAKKLKDFIDNKVRSSKVDIVAHSMGGLVVSSYIADLNGGDKIRKLITIATPYLGSTKVPYVFATGNLIESAGFKIARKGIKKIAPHMTSAYQLLPYNNVDPYIGIFDKKEEKWYSIYENIYYHHTSEHYFIKNTLRMTGIDDEKISSSIKGNFIDKSIAYMEGIHPKGIAAIESVDRHVIVGMGKPTIYYTIFDSSGDFMYDLDFKDGDGTVPYWSASINDSVSTYSFKYKHTDLVRKKKVIEQVKEILGSKTPTNYGDSTGGSPYVVVRIACPVDVIVSHNGELLTNIEDQLNTETEFGSLYIVGEDEDIKILALDTDNIYDIELQGADAGTMDYSIRFFDYKDNLIEERMFIDVPITEHTRIITNTEQDEITTLSVDTDGDGTYDKTIYPEGHNTEYSVKVIAKQGGTATGAGTYESGTQATLIATPYNNYIFEGWYEDGNKVAINTTYTFNVKNNRVLEARFSYNYSNYRGDRDEAISESATLDKKKISFDKFVPKDIDVTLSKGDYTFRNIKNGDYRLIDNKDYISFRNNYVIKADYLAMLDEGITTLVFNMSGGNNPELTITIKDTSPEDTKKEDANLESTDSNLDNNNSDISENDVLINGRKAIFSLNADGNVTVTATELEKLSEPILLSIPFIDGESTHTGVVKKGGQNIIIPFSVYKNGRMILLVTEPGEYSVINNKKTFIDTDGHWAHDTINFITAREIFSGVDANRFEPEGGMTRAMFVQTLVNIEGYNSYTSTSRFIDVEDNAWYISAVEWAASNGIIEGYGNGLFGPNDFITREQMAVILNNYLKYKGLILLESNEYSLFADEEHISPWAREAVANMKRLGMIAGIGNNVYSPRDPVNRASVAQILRNFIEVYMNRIFYLK